MRSFWLGLLAVLLPLCLSAQSANSLYNEAVNHYLDGEIQQAREHVELALKIQKRFPNGWFLLGQTYREDKAYKKAIKYYNKALKLTPTDADFTYHKALAYQHWGKSKPAVKYYFRTTKIDSKYALAWDRLAEIFSDAGDHWSAAEYYGRSIDLNPTKESTYMNRAREWYAVEAFENVLSECLFALDLNPENADAYALRSKANFQLGDYLHAVNDLSQVIDRRPDSANYYQERAVSLQILELFLQAREDLDRAILLDSTMADAWWNRALLNLTEGRLEEGRRDVEKATVYNPYDEEAWLLLGRIAFQQRNYKEALRAYNYCITLEKGYAEAYLNRGEAKRVLGDISGACKDWKRVTKLDKDGEMGPKAENWMLINCE